MPSHPPTSDGSSNGESSGSENQNQSSSLSRQAFQSESTPNTGSAAAALAATTAAVEIDPPPNLNNETESPTATATEAASQEPVPPRTVEQPEASSQPRRRFILTRRATNSGTTGSSSADTTTATNTTAASTTPTPTATTNATTATARAEANAEHLALQAQWSRALSGLRNGHSSVRVTTTSNANNANHANATDSSTTTNGNREPAQFQSQQGNNDSIADDETSTNTNSRLNTTTTTTPNSNTANPTTPSTTTTRIRMRLPPGARLSGRRIRVEGQPYRARIITNITTNGAGGGGSSISNHNHNHAHPAALMRAGTAAAVAGGTGTGSGTGLGTATTVQTDDQGPFLVYSVTVPPLAGRVLADSRQQLVEQDAARRQVEQDLERFVCPICFEFLKDPASCGQCATRFCYECLSKVLTQRRQSTSQCPICRQDLRAIQRDEELQRELEHAAMIPCRYQDCDELLRLAQVAEHEAVCARVCVACPYAEYGCEWKGTRKDCKEHEATECAYGQVSSLVQDVRNMRADYGNRFRNVVHRLRAVDGLVDAHVQLVRANNARKSPSNPLDLVAFVIAISCTTPYFLWTKNRWTCLYASAEARACVYNTLAVFPTLLVALKFVVAGYQEIVTTLSAASSSETAMAQTETDYLIDLSLLTLILLLLGILVPVCLHVDGRSSQRWQFLAIPRVGERRVIMNIVAVSLAMIHGLIYEITGGKLNSVLICLWVEISSILMPAIVARTSLAATREEPRTERPHVLTTGRASRPLLFGLRFGFVVARLGLMPSLDAALLIQVMQERHRLVAMDLAFENEILLSSLSRSLCLQYLGLRVVVKAHEWFRHGTLTKDSLLALITLLALNFFFHRLASLGATIGDVMAESAKVELIPTGRGVLKDYSGVGVTAFGVWAFVNLLILMS